MKGVLFILIITYTISGFSQIEELPQIQPYFTAIIVKDIDTSTIWYSKVLGFKVLNHINLEERGIKQTNLKSNESLLELIEIKSSINTDNLLKDKQRRLQGFFKCGFMVSDFNKWIRYLQKSEVEFHGNVVTDKVSNKKMVIIKDPDGNRIQLFEK